MDENEEITIQTDETPHYYAVIMAGGGGTRMWPLSRQNRPKQLISFAGERSLFQMTIDRLEGLFPFQRIMVVAPQALIPKLQQQYPRIPRNNYIIEPQPKGTASVVGLAAIALRQRDPDPQTTMAVLPADHFILNVPYFVNILRAALDGALDGNLVTVGIKPTYAATKFGYLKRGEWVGGYQGLAAFRVTRFVEKPDENTARLMIKMENHDWNSGMFVWRVEHILKKFRQLMPDLAIVLDKCEKVWEQPNRMDVINSHWSTLKVETIDYGIMERANDIAVIPAVNLGWSDAGTWDSLFEILPVDDDGNLVLGADHIGVDTLNSLIYSEKTDKKAPVIVTIGTRNLIVVNTGDAILICPRDDAQKVKKAIDKLNSMGRTDLL